ncbi:MAG: toxin-antitoxin system HicB family antitoxin [Gammaproteobacteria bacterium]|uniref:Toxin-antitoxin system HicB family antitoxin n=1 Tax=Candidatus Thiopontia autotrophica TaxID=2841688 RepID=A0A8J6P9X6_9GAMM|nr:toxin-antitoxin system HicB family antitoxin [Candidatus Thiopontia autotrophica]
MKERDRYLKIVEWSEEDQCYVGSVPGWIGQACHGDNEEKVYHQLCQIVDEWIDIYKKDGNPLPEPTAGKTYSGKFVLRMEPELHKQLAIHAAQAGVSLNKYCSQQLESCSA